MQPPSHASLTVPQLRQEMARRGLPIPHAAIKRDLVRALDSLPALSGNVSNSNSNINVASPVDIRAAALLSLRSTHRSPRAPSAVQVSQSPAENVQQAVPPTPSRAAPAELLSLCRMLPQKDVCDALKDALRKMLALHSHQSHESLIANPGQILARFLETPGSRPSTSLLSSAERAIVSSYTVSSRTP
jgi:hypothetical protein